jgi:hypothetical protein
MIDCLINTKLIPEAEFLAICERFMNELDTRGERDRYKIFIVLLVIG